MTTTAPARVLEYATAPAPRPWRLQGFILLATSPAFAVPFMDFVWGISPFAVVAEAIEDRSFNTFAITLLGFGFFTAWPTLAWRFLRLLRHEPGRPAHRGFMALAIVAWSAVVWLNVLWIRAVADEVKNGGKWLAMIMEGYPFLLGILVCMAGLLIAWRLNVCRNHARVMAVILTTPYLANAAICLTAFATSDPTVGYLLTLIVSLVLAMELAADAFRMRRE